MHRAQRVRGEASQVQWSEGDITYPARAIYRDLITPESERTLTLIKSTNRNEAQPQT